MRSDWKVVTDAADAVLKVSTQQARLMMRERSLEQYRRFAGKISNDVVAKTIT
ncbi:hypothetical protein N9L76_01495 [bacterium]|nr:hypothetical protein [bacterium]